MDVDFTRLRMLLELQQRGTVTRVAEVLSYSHSAVSQQLKTLERDTGFPLLERAGRNVRLTTQGQVLADYAARIFALADEAEAALANSTDDVRGTLRVAGFQTVLAAATPSALDTLSVRHPGLRVELTQRDIEEGVKGLASRGFDVVIGEDYPGVPQVPTEGFDVEVLWQDTMHLLFPQKGPYSELPRELDALREAPLAVDPEAHVMGRWVRDLCRSSGFEPSVRYSTPDPFLQMHLVRGGHALALAPQLIIRGGIDGVDIADLPGAPRRTLWTAVRAGAETHPAVIAFRRALAEQGPAE